MLTPLSITAAVDSGISDGELRNALTKALGARSGKLKRVLLIVPDFTRFHSNAGFIANFLFHKLTPETEVDLLEALGTHFPMTREQCAKMYGDIPFDSFIPHNWRTDTVKLGVVPEDFIREVSEGVMDVPFDVELNAKIFDGYDLILSIGQVVPHEIVGMANHSKNVLIGCGGASMINLSHMLGAFYGMERIMGRDKTPVRKVLDYASEKYLANLPLAYILTVTTAPENRITTHGLYIGQDRSCFEDAIATSLTKNLTLLDTPIKKALVFLDEDEFHSTWLGNKAIYRTRMAMADDGELIVLAPGVRRFGEDDAVDALIRKYGYCGRETVIRLFRENADLRANQSAAAHLIHGSSDGRFSVTYCTKHLREDEVRGVGFGYLPYDEAVAKYNLRELKDNPCNPEADVFYIPNPALGLWADKSRFL